MGVNSCKKNNNNILNLKIINNSKEWIRRVTVKELKNYQETSKTSLRKLLLTKYNE